MTRTEVDEIVREHIEVFLGEIIAELGSRGFRTDDPHNVVVRKSTLLNALNAVRDLYNITP